MGVCGKKFGDVFRPCYLQTQGCLIKSSEVIYAKNAEWILRRGHLILDVSSIADWFFNSLRSYLSSMGIPLHYVGFLLLIWGFLMAFFGRKLFYILLFLFSGLLVGGVVYVWMLITGRGLLLALGLGVVGFLCGGVIAILILYGILTLIGAGIGFIVGLALFHDAGMLGLIGLIITIIVFAGFVVALFESYLVISTAIQGGSIMALGLFFWAWIPYRDITAFGMLLAVLGATFQIFGKGPTDQLSKHFSRQFGTLSKKIDAKLTSTLRRIDRRFPTLSRTIRRIANRRNRKSQIRYAYALDFSKQKSSKRGSQTSWKSYLSGLLLLVIITGSFIAIVFFLLRIASM